MSYMMNAGGIIPRILVRCQGCETLCEMGASMVATVERYHVLLFCVQPEWVDSCKGYLVPSGSTLVTLPNFSWIGSFGIFFFFLLEGVFLFLQ